MNHPVRIGVYLQEPYVNRCAFTYRTLEPLGARCPYPGVVAEIVHLLLRAMFVDFELVFMDPDLARRDILHGSRNETTGEWSGYNGLLRDGTLDMTTVLAAHPYMKNAHFEDFIISPVVLPFVNVYMTSKHSTKTSIISDMSTLTNAFSLGVWIGLFGVLIITIFGYKILKSINFDRAHVILNVAGCLLILMIPLYGNVLSVKFANPFVMPITQKQIEANVASGTQRVALVDDCSGYSKLIESFLSWKSLKIPNKNEIVCIDSALPDHSSLLLDSITHENTVYPASNWFGIHQALSSDRMNEVVIVRQTDSNHGKFTASFLVNKTNAVLGKLIEQAIYRTSDSIDTIMSKYSPTTPIYTDATTLLKDETHVTALTINNFAGLLYVCGVLLVVAGGGVLVEVGKEKWRMMTKKYNDRNLELSLV